VRPTVGNTTVNSNTVELILVMLAVVELVKKLPTFYVTRNFITVFTTILTGPHLESVVCRQNSPPVHH